MPDIGAVPVSGSRKVSPRTTTTYRITVRGAGGQTQTASVTVRVVISEQAALTALYETTGGSGLDQPRELGDRTASRGMARGQCR